MKTKIWEIWQNATKIQQVSSFLWKKRASSAQLSKLEQRPCCYSGAKSFQVTRFFSAATHWSYIYSFLSSWKRLIYFKFPSRFFGFRRTPNWTLKVWVVFFKRIIVGQDDKESFISRKSSIVELLSVIELVIWKITFHLWCFVGIHEKTQTRGHTEKYQHKEPLNTFKLDLEDTKWLVPLITIGSVSRSCTRKGSIKHNIGIISCLVLLKPNTGRALQYLSKRPSK